MWQEFGPILSAMRRRDVNKQHGYGLLNGQAELKDVWQKVILPIKEISLLFIFTDGFIYYPESKNEKFLAEKTYKLYQKGGLEAILNETRIAETMEKKTSHIDYGEATAIAIEF